MGLFGSSAAEEREAKLLGRLDALAAQLDRAKAETAVLEEIESLKQQAVDLRVANKEQRADHERELKRLTEDHERNVREIEHKVGLAQKANEQDREAAVKEAKLEVREANLEGEKSLFKQQMDFQRDEMQKRADAQDKLLESILDRLPKHNVHEFRGDTPSKTQAQLAAGDGAE